MSNNTLSRLKPPKGSSKTRTRVGRGTGSGLGKTAGRGHKGHRARSGGGVHPRFEGGQMPLMRRLPKRGFHNPFRKEFVVVNVGALQQTFQANTHITLQMLQENNLVPSNPLAGVKILGDGELHIPLTVQAHSFSQSARQKIESVGGRVEVIGRVE